MQPRDAFGGDQVRASFYRLELLSGLGVLALGLGMGVLFGAFLKPVAVILLIAGGIAHGAAMVRRHQLERRAGEWVPWWKGALYWFCWILLTGVATYFARP